MAGALKLVVENERGICLLCLAGEEREGLMPSHFAEEEGGEVAEDKEKEERGGILVFFFFFFKDFFTESPNFFFIFMEEESIDIKFNFFSRKN